MGGISLVLSSYERSLWFDHDIREYNPKGWGIELELVWGKMIRPVPKFWKKGFWKGEDEYNPWKGGEYWFIIRCPMIGPFISVALGRYGVYLGLKTFRAYKGQHDTLERYGKWMREDEFGTEDNPRIYLQLSASTRSTRWK